MQTFRSPNRYKITAPRGWTINLGGTTGCDIILSAKPSDGFANNVTVRVDPAPNGQTLEQMQRYIKTSYTPNLIKCRFIPQRATSICQQPTCEMIYHYKYGTPSRLYWLRQDIVIRRGKLYIFTCTALASNAARFRIIFNRIISSVQWIS